MKEVCGYYGLKVFMLLPRTEGGSRLPTVSGINSTWFEVKKISEDLVKDNFTNMYFNMLNFIKKMSRQTQ